ncbi:argonaute/piwi family protein [Christiangramia echinicola]|uniref:argonaute/piwi family protein n=1 Tax=Christiangramia echinicola TaxID=279359 RepID=UPI001969D5A1|nr:hypothetical protein [Christiangramia echinicola]
MTTDLFHIEEPKLTFGYKQKMIDPRDGITLFGPNSNHKISGKINIGVIGTEISRERMISYLQKIHKPVESLDNDKARPMFPGLEAAYGININFENIASINVPTEDIEEFLHYTDSHQRVHNLTNLFADKIFNYVRREENPVTIWFIVIPKEIYLYGRPNSRIPSSDENIKIGLKKNERNSQQVSLFFQDENKKLQEAYKYQVNFHNQLKAKLLQEKIISQIIIEDKIAYEEIWDDETKIDSEKKFDSAKAWNISTTLYYKCGGLPWKLGDVRNGVCYLGLVFKRLNEDANHKNACCAAQMFLDSGDGMVFRGNVGPWFNPAKNEFHLSKDDAFEIISQSLEAFKDYSGDYPKEVFIHAKTYFENAEWKGFTDATEGKSKIIGIRIRDDSAFKLHRNFSYCVPRGSVMSINSDKAYVWTRGFIPRLQTQLGLEVPNPLSVEITRGESNIRDVCKDILALTKLNYNTCSYGDGIPVTLKFAESIGEILTAGKDVKSSVLPFKHYI